MNTITLDETFTETHEMTGKCPFGGDRIGGAFGTPPTLESWYPDRLRVELLHQNGLPADPTRGQPGHHHRKPEWGTAAALSHRWITVSARWSSKLSIEGLESASSSRSLLARLLVVYS